MAMLQTAETKLEGIFNGLPDMSDSSRESLVNFWPWIALIFGILQLLAAWGLWQLTQVTQNLINLEKTWSAFYTAAKPVGLSAGDKFVIYVGILVLLVDGVILLMAYPRLKRRSRRGWDLIFLGALINVGYSVLSLFIHDRGFGSFLFSLLGSAVGFYLLFQVREKYNGKRKTAKATK